jgi:ACS family hexuronate transporter-like MFS transporter
MGNQTIGNYRWAVVSLLFFATTINYIDRQVIGLLKPTLEAEFNWSQVDYSYIVMAFTAMYALGYVLFGSVIDKVGSKIGYGISVFFWSIAAMFHAAVNSTLGFGIARGFLGLSESGNFPAGVKVVAEWFPKKERALAMGIFNSGTSIGPVLAPIIVPLLLAIYGWRYAFLITGVLGFIWLVFWWIYYEIPSKQKRLKESEFKHIHSDIDAKTEGTSVKIKWKQLLGFRQTWVFIVGKALTDPVWWFLLFWLPSYFADTFMINLSKPSIELAVIYTATTIGSIGGGYLSSMLIKQDWLVLKARQTTLLIAALGVTPIVLAKFTTDIWVVVAIISLATAAHQAWSSNIFTIVSDIVPKQAVSSVVGIGGMAGSIAATLFPLLAGVILEYFTNRGNITAGYNILFIISGLAYILAWIIIRLLSKNMKPMGV